MSRRTVIFATSVGVGESSSPQVVSLTNFGGGTLTVNSVELTGADASQFSRTHDCTSLAAGASCTIRVTLRPTSAGSKTATLSVAHNASGSPTRMTLSGLATAAAVVVQGSALNPSSVTDLDVLKYVASNPDLIQAFGTDLAKAREHYLTYGASENRPLTFDPLRYTASHGDLIESTGLDLEKSVRHYIEKGYTEGRQVTFDPAAYLKLNPDLAGAVSLEAAVKHYLEKGYSEGRATSNDPVMQVNVSALSFGTQVLTLSTTPRVVTIRNAGAADLIVSGVSVKGTDAAQFTVTQQCGRIAKGGSCTINVVFKPTRAGGRLATLSIEHNAAGSPNVVELTGTGLAAPIIEVSPLAGFDFAAQRVGRASTAREVTIRNLGTADLLFTGGVTAGIALGGADTSQFARTTNCGATLAPNSSCTVSVTFSPTSAGAKSASLAIAHNATASAATTGSTATTGSPITLKLAGTGVTPVIEVSPTSLAFGEQVVNVTSAGRAVAVKNSGTAPLAINGITVSGADGSQFAQTNTCGTSVAAGASCTVTVTFRPTTAGAKSASITIEHDAVGSPSTVSLAGTGVAAPIIEVGPAALTFGNQLVNSPSAAQTVTISNSASATADLTFTGGAASAITLTGAEAGQFVRSTNCPTALAPGSSCTVSVIFTPTSAGGKSASVSILHNALGSPSTVTLSGTGTAPIIGVSATSLGFGNQLINTASGAQTITIGNTGTADLVFTGGGAGSFTLTGTHASEFARTTTCGASIAPNSSCTVSVTFTPTSTGAKSASLSIAHSAAGNPSSVSLAGTGTAPIIGVSPTTLNFGSQRTSVASAAQKITVTNTGTANLTVSGVSVTGTDVSQFAQTNDCGSAVAPNASCTINVTFKPTSTAAKSAAISITHNAAGSPTSVGLAGTGTAPSISVTPTALTFGNQLISTPSAGQTITISNSGTAELVFTGGGASAITVGGTDATQFSRTTTCGASLAPNANCTVSVTFTPTSSGAKSASVSIVHDAAGSPTAVGLSGTGTAPIISVSPTTLSFGNQRTNLASAAQTITIGNTGTADLVFTGGGSSAITVGGTDAGQFARSTTCGASLAPNASCTVSVTFTPTSSGAKSASLSIAHNAAGSPTAVSLSGTGATPIIGVSPSSLSFGNQRTNVASAAQTVTISNTGVGDLVFTGGGASAITLTGTNASEFARTTTCGASLAAGANCTVSLTFTPTSTGAKSATLSIAHNATGSPSSVSLTGTGTAPTVSVSPTGVSFGNQLVNTTSDGQTITITNSGTGPLTFGSGGGLGAITLTGPDAGQFTRTTSCGTTLAPSASCDVQVTFSPTTAGSKSANVSIAHNASGSPTTIALSGAAGYNLSVAKTGTGGGTVTSSSGLNCGLQCSQFFTEPSSVTLSATPTTGSTFAGWSGAGCSGTGTCVVTMDAVRSVTATFTQNTYAISVDVSGLTGTVVLQNILTNDLSRSTNGTAPFTTLITHGNPYSVSVLTQPVGQTCTVASGSGTATAPVTVAVSCTTNSYAISVNVSGLTGTVVLQNNLTNDLSRSANGTAPFTTLITHGNPYSVSVLTQPVGQTCTVASGSGTATAPVTVAVSCTTNSYAISVNVAGLTGTVVLQNNLTNDLSRSTNGTAPFTTLITHGNPYSVSVLTQPVGQTCTVASGSGTAT
ncbi:MAG: choice-of-anchor D domain-containing protein, partial [Gammaproteobacteria bacterium]|nr:choice-of-anchor D domain-containing protein [Gammaproteobacteria bacterium]